VLGQDVPVPVRHAADGYECNFCKVVRGDRGPLTSQHDVIYRTEDMTAFVSSHWWPANPGHVLIIPNRHIENLYEFPPELGTPLMDATRRVAIALKAAFRCDGVSTRQHNEPAGDQDVWHFHQHVFPRWEGDRLYVRHAEKALAPEDERRRRASRLRDALRP
jgi:histidine triad (HIT) family protein